MSKPAFYRLYKIQNKIQSTQIQSLQPNRTQICTPTLCPKVQFFTNNTYVHIKAHQEKVNAFYKSPLRNSPTAFCNSATVQV